MTVTCSLLITNALESLVVLFCMFAVFGNVYMFVMADKPKLLKT